ncbi:MAG: thioredoxin family protein [Bacteroidales bacterium]
MEIIVLGTGCAGCKNLYNAVEKAIEELGLQANLKKEEDLMKIMEYNVMRMPALVVDGKVISSGKSLGVKDVKELLAK